MNFAWRNVVCCKEHYYYHIPIIEYVRKTISKEEARTQLSQAIKDYGEINFVDDIKGVVNEIMAEPERKSKKKEVKIVEQEIEEIPVIEELPLNE